MDAQPTSFGGTLAAIAAALVLILANGLFVAAEFALVRVRPGRLKALARQGRVSAVRALFLVQHLDEALSVSQVGITLCSLGLGFLGEPAFARLFEALFGGVLSSTDPHSHALVLSLSLAASFLLVTFLLVVVGELIPKRIAIGVAERVLLAIAPPLRLFWWCSWPLVVLFNSSARVALRWVGFSRAQDEAVHSREEIRQLLTLSARTGQFGAWELGLLNNLFRFGKRRARDAMLPRSRVIALDLRQPVETLLARARQEGYSRYPLVEGDLDHVVGILHMKDVFAALPAEGAAIDLRRLARQPLVVPETLSLDRLLRRFQSDRGHLAMVADEYGAVLGIVTLEDVLEELVGELRDEFDAEEQDQVRPRAGGGYVLDPALPFDRAAELVTEPPPPPEDVHTIAGLLQSELGRLPQAGDRIPFGPRHDLVAAVVQGARILRIELVPRQ